MLVKNPNFSLYKLNILILLHWMKADGSGIYYSRLARKLSERGHSIIVASTGGPLVKDLEDNGIAHYKLPVLDLGYSSVYVRIFEIISSIKSQIGKKFNVVSEVESNLRSSEITEITFTKALRYPLRIALFLSLWAFSMIKLLIMIKKEKIDVIDSHSIGATVLAFICSKIMNVPFLVRVSAPRSVGLPPLMFRHIYPAVGGIIAVSQECVDYMGAGYEWEEEKIKIMHNSVDIQRFRPFSADEKVHYERELIEHGVSINRDGKKIVFVSRLDEDKEKSIVSAIRSIPEIATIIPDIQLIVVGDGNIFGRIYELVERVNKKQGRKTIVMTGYMDHVERILNLSDIVVATGGTAVEAMACGKPVIVAGERTGPQGGNFGGIVTPDNINEMRNYYFTGRHSKERTNPAKIVEACVKLLKDPKWMEDLGAFGRSFVIEECNLEKNVAIVEEMYFNAVKQWA